MQLILVRHGQSTNNVRLAEAMAAGLGRNQTDEQIAPDVSHYLGRVPDPPLSALGMRQAEALGRALLDERTPFTPTHLYASPTTRAVQTVRPLADAARRPVLLHPDAYEVGGIHVFDPPMRTRQARPGATLMELLQHCPAVEAPPGLFHSSDEPWSGGLETQDEQAVPRAQRLLARLREAHGPDDVVLVVTHQHFSQFVLAAVLGWDGPPWQRFRLDNTGHLSLRFGDGPASVDWVNRVEHLNPEDISN
ncbi:histidine phosphatase family protein [Streptomyces sp. DT2A-34]|uniref:histidine phosphatase family protein n=1 Tax=Streptomyces sp. DT2A-34 TaxID=3051182 RepID=UPI00265BE3E0|nr:histidine phosphatase family protein [Streptomyces sp. DT2A-34]MDO0911051.1 histidine phosphatase family protein [Streptomyces sp. DT2A-34]